VSHLDWNPGPAWLFCPADRPDRFSKAYNRSDVVIFDLEDAVAPSAKSAARAALAAAELVSLRTVVRINATSSAEHEPDLRMAKRAGVPVMLPKAESRRQVESLGDVPVIALVESAVGIQKVDEIAAAGNVIGLMWGSEDLIASLGGSGSRDVSGHYRDIARYARSRALIAAKAGERLALDSINADFADLDGLRLECDEAAAVGYDVTVAIHPAQVPVIRQAYMPAADQVEWARQLLAAVGEAGGVSVFNGRMVDGPIYKQAQRILRRAGT
jgi:citrate lyase subunit beta/citryl-CoA lyase